MRKYVLLAGSIAAVMLLAFLGGMQLGQAQMYDYLTFGNAENEVYVKVVYHDDNILIKRYREDNRISIVDSVLEANPANLEQLRQKLEEELDRIPGLDNYELQNNELTLFKLENVRWEDLLQQVFAVLFTSSR